MFSFSFILLLVVLIQFIKRIQSSILFDIFFCGLMISTACVIDNKSSVPPPPPEIAKYAFIPKSSFNTEMLFERNKYDRRNVHLWINLESHNLSYADHDNVFVPEMMALRIYETVHRAIQTFCEKEMSDPDPHPVLLLLERMDFFPLAVFLNVKGPLYMGHDVAREMMKDVRFIVVYNI